MRPVSLHALDMLKPLNRPTYEHESIYSVWTEFCTDSQIDQSEMRSFRFNHRSVFSYWVEPQKVISEIATAMGRAQVEVARYIGFDMMLPARSQVLFPALRFCKVCLRMGYHSIVFQHVAIEKCPLHNIRLDEKCTSCGSYISPSFSATVQSPFECPCCNAQLSSTVFKRNDLLDAQRVDYLLGIRRKDLTRGDRNARTYARFSELPFVLRESSSPSAQRHFQRNFVWSTHPISQWVNFPEERFELSEAEISSFDPLIVQKDIGRAQVQTLLWLMQACRKHIEGAIYLLDRLGRNPLGARLAGRASLISVALYQLALAYDLTTEMRLLFEDLSGSGLVMQLPLLPHRGFRLFGSQFPARIDLTLRLARQEMQGLFAKLLVRHRGKEFVQEVSWIDIPHPIEFASRWCLERIGSSVLIRVRARITEDQLARLLTRVELITLGVKDEAPILRTWPVAKICIEATQGSRAKSSIRERDSQTNVVRMENCSAVKSTWQEALAAASTQAGETK